MHRYTTTELHGMATGTQDTTKAIRDELDIYKHVSVRMMEQTSAKVQKNADITEELRLVLEKFLNTAQASVVEQTTFVSQPVVSNDDGKTQERVADSGASAPTSTAERDQEAKCKANETKAVHAAEQSTAVDEVQISPTQDEIHHSNDNNGHSKYDAEHDRFTSPPSAPVEKVVQEKKSTRPKCSTASNPPLPLEQSSATPTMSNPEKQDTELLNAVRVAARNNNVEMLGLLLDMGVDVNAVDPSESEGTALQVACFGSFEAVRYLLQRNADPNIGKGQSLAKRPRYAIT